MLPPALLLTSLALVAGQDADGTRPSPPVFGPPRGPCRVQTAPDASANATAASPASAWLCAPFLANYPAQYTLDNATATDERVRELREQAIHSPVWVTYDEDRSTVGPQRCLEAYTRWLCAQAFPMCRSDGATNATTSVLPCFTVCEDVVDRCSSYHQFSCPARDPPPGDEYVVDDYGVPYFLDVEHAAGEWDIGCNSMGLPSAAGRAAASTLALVLVALACV